MTKDMIIIGFAFMIIGYLIGFVWGYFIGRKPYPSKAD